ncbi:MAG: flagellar hook-length control protein FliK [Azonexus sp.]|nr:flagellar hook-length control protein FliK [Azonexus sp.]MBP6908020.1 flagellar hook-length control protein FliK [Azonexus sp.]
MIPADVAARLRLVLPEQPAAPQPAIPAQQLKDVLSDLVPGQRILAEIQALLPNGTYRAAVAQREVTLALPFAAKPGDTLELEVVERGNRLVLAAVAERSTQTAKTPGDSVATTLSPAARLIGTLMSEIGAPGDRAPPAPLNASRPLLSGAPGDAAQLAPVLQEAVVKSGLFYESHQARWVAGQMPTAALLEEPQGRLSTPVVAPPPPAQATEGTALQAEAPSLAPAAGATARAALAEGSVPASSAPAESPSASTAALREGQQAMAPGLPATLTPLVQQQLDALATQVLSWQGQIWPGQTLEWDIEDAPQSRPGEEGADSRRWTTRLRLTLPRLGAIDATLRLDAQGGVDLSLSAGDATTTALLSGKGNLLAHRLADAGLSLAGLHFDHAASGE